MGYNFILQHSLEAKICMKWVLSVASTAVLVRRGWSGGAMVLGKLSVPGRPTNLD